MGKIVPMSFCSLYQCNAASHLYLLKYLMLLLTYPSSLPKSPQLIAFFSSILSGLPSLVLSTKLVSRYSVFFLQFHDSSHNRPLRTHDQPPGKVWTINHQPSSPMIQPIINPYTSLPTKTAMSQLGYENYIAKVKVDDTHQSLPIHRLVSLSWKTISQPISIYFL